MDLTDTRVGFALTGSFCTFSAVLPQIERLVSEGAAVTPVMSETAAITDTRFGKAEEIIGKIEKITGNKVIKTINGAEKIGPQKLFDIIIVAPCTGNTLGKIAGGITDTSVTMAVKAHLRNVKPVLIAVSTNDGLAGSFKNIGQLLNTKNIYFVPFGQDDFEKKPTSLVSNMDKIVPATISALEGRQLQPVLN